MTPERSSRPIRGDRGAAAAELALVVPVLVMIIGLVVAGGRLWLARQAVEDAA
ncbi:TadE/TadG family type IV pilus assembly protein, partial [Desertihabitans aurantiacus]|uniref:TadE/TadG family type IV pilus assembly protein n=1 Tax=Desertihabitans aurantiacus TaxID=2282477 RepID=UPI0018E532B1